MYRLLEHLGNPHQNLTVVHVAGTSGKTSTAYYTAALLQGAGKRVGLTISPHVDEVNERVQIDLSPMPEAKFAARFAIFLKLVASSGVMPNYFELFLAFALWEFAAQQVDYAVVEVGIGGLLDSSNVFDDPRKVCIITDIGYDHMNVLGSTLPEIAAQKTGIIQLHNPVFCYRQEPAVTTAIEHQAATKQADLHTLTRVPAMAMLPTLPLFQQRNFGLALTAVRYIAERDQLRMPEGRHLETVARTYIPARMETHTIDGKTVILDAAHNPQKFEALLASLHAQYGDTPVAALVRLGPHLDGRRAAGSAKQLVHGVQHVIVTSLPSDEGVDAAGYESFEVIADARSAFTALLKRPEPILVVAGSFYVLNHIRPLVRGRTATTA
ncbi:MAG TPA: Mur ligase family protein [Candidatus Saccharimonadales bacterium]|nr:Mur ligase family protein [Candidatus Saccharimonadales bacterium]